MSEKRIALGRRGEDLAVEYLVKDGYKVIGRNIREKFAEVDLIAVDRRGVVVFVEVKTRRSRDFGRGWEAVGKRKQHKIIMAAKMYMAQHCWSHKRIRFDVIDILAGDDGTVEIDHLQQAFDASEALPFT